MSFYWFPGGTACYLNLLRKNDIVKDVLQSQQDEEFFFQD